MGTHHEGTKGSNVQIVKPRELRNRSKMIGGMDSERDMDACERNAGNPCRHDGSADGKTRRTLAVAEGKSLHFHSLWASVRS